MADSRAYQRLYKMIVTLSGGLLRARACLAVASLLFLGAGPPTIRIEGRASGPGGTPLRDGRALLIRIASDFEAGRLEIAGKADPDPAASVPVAADGTFRLEAPEPGLWKVIVQSPGLVPQEHRLVPLVEETDLPAVRLETDRKLEVRVAGPDGRPLAGARVRAEDPSLRTLLAPWRKTARAGITDDKGVAVLPRGATETLAVTVAAPGLALAERKDVRVSALAVKLTPGRARDLRIVDAVGKAVASALVRLGESGRAAGQTAADGRLAVLLEGPAKRSVVASTEDGRSATGSVTPVTAQESGPRILRLPPLQTLSGRVVSKADGRPVAGAVVWADLGDVRLTGADGGYKLSAVPGRHLRVQAGATGYLQADAEWPVQAGELRAPTLALEPALAAAGVVVDEQGRGVGGVEIRTAFKPGSRIRSPSMFRSGGVARTAASGRFRIPGLLAGLGHELKLAKQGYAPATVDLPPLEPGRPSADLRIVLHRGRTAFGRVLDPSRQPVAGARVVLEEAPPADMMARMMALRRRNDEPSPFEAATDAAGRFEIADLPPGSFELTASGAGYAPLQVPGLEIPAGEGRTDLGTLLLAPGAALEGIVVDPGGKPVAAADVLVAEPGGRFPLPSLARQDAPPAATTAQDGSFRIEDRRPGETLDLTVRRSGYAPAAVPGVQVPSETPLRVVLVPAAVVEGRTVDPDGKPVAGAFVLIEAAEEEVARIGAFRSATSADDGSFRIADVAPGAFQITAEAGGYQKGRTNNLEVRSGQELKGVEVVLARGAVLQGRVLSPTGQPLAGARVSLVEPQAMMPDFFGQDASTDGDGYYRLDQLAPGTRNFRAEHEGYRKTVRELEVRAGENTLDFSLEGGVEISGRVIDEGGNPIGNARVLLRQGAGSWGLPNATSGPDGSFTLAGVADGVYRLSAEKSGYAPDEGQPVTVAGTSVGGVEVKLSTGGAIVGQISGVEFSDLADLRVWSDFPMHSGRVGPDATYRIDNVEVGEHRVVASLRGERQAEGRIKLDPGAAEAHLDLELGNGLRLAGRVLRNGQPVVGGRVLLSAPSVAGRQSDLDHEGSFRFEDLDEGTYELEVLGPTFQTLHKETVTLSRDRDDLLIQLSTVSLVGRVIDSADRGPISGAVVRLLPPQGEGDFFPIEATTDSKGQFRLSSVPEGDWRVRALLSGYAPGEQPVQVSADAPPPDLEIALQATEGVTLEVWLASGQPPDSVRAAVLDAAGRVVASATYPVGEDGRLRVASVAPGTWELLLDADGAATVSVPVTAPGHAGRVVLPPAGGLDLKVGSLEGARVTAKARLTDSRGMLYRSVFRGGISEFDVNDGAASFERLAPGVWRVDVTAADGRTWSGSATVVPGGTAQVTLE
jgi:hypothetical protein